MTKKRKYYSKERFHSTERNLNRYGLTLWTYNELLSRQKYCCALCGRSAKKNEFLSVDHDHGTGTVRGLICQRCNLGLAYFDAPLFSLLVEHYLGTIYTRTKGLGSKSKLEDRLTTVSFKRKSA